MKIETQALEDRQTKLIAEFDSETLEQYKRRAARKIAQNAKIPGFRPGKAPYDVVRRMYGDSAIQQEAIELLVDDMYPQVLKEANIDPYGQGKLEEIISMDPPKFSFVIPLAPEVTLGDYKSIRKEYAPEPVTDAQVDETLTRLRRSYGTAVPVERAAQEGDMVSFKMSARRLAPAEGEQEELLGESSYQMTAGEKEEEKWPYEGFTKELVGLSANETKTFNHTFGDDTQYEGMAGKEAEFKVEVQNVKEMNLPELDDEFARTVGSEFETLEDLRKAIRTQLEQNYQQQYDQNYYEELVEAMAAQASVSYPPSALDEEIDEFVHNVEHDLSHQQLDLETYLKIRGLDRAAFIETEVKPAAVRRLTRSLVMSEFAQQEGVTLSPQEMQEIYAMATRQMAQSEELKRIQAQQKRNTRDMVSTIAQNTANNIFNQRVMDRMKAIATGKGDEAPAEITETTSIINEPVALPDLLNMQAGEPAEPQAEETAQPLDEETAETADEPQAEEAPETGEEKAGE